MPGYTTVNLTLGKKKIINVKNKNGIVIIDKTGWGDIGGGRDAINRVSTDPPDPTNTEIIKTAETRTTQTQTESGVEPKTGGVTGHKNPIHWEEDKFLFKMTKTLLPLP